MRKKNKIKKPTTTSSTYKPKMLITMYWDKLNKKKDK